ncbi:methyltransferase [Rhodoblastus acidophilus]|uniref:Methyltransferase n=1 Tax=Candidatus Rhodoblastus alkanivorans TaxID=2954117 RepID=A0ABS9Z3I2_9HYPH|nr:methyltransferase [Candidatus Rhodoblastus alkanivorans]MCI4677270.1 methyltransferase [Candidatus Rhodoblastus alkanivorans]MCI4682005.1 methyltransferase [Candidatus Rhodoblastus alkanivorans]MDI4643056.1 methyltransferase [Rhodoblastus acidophilus]
MATNCARPDPDGLFDGGLLLHQPARGHRVGADAVLLAAAAPAVPRGLIVDAGAGVGAVGLALALWNPLAQAALLEKNPAAAALARQNIPLNGLEGRARVVEADLFDVAARKAEGLAEAADLVVTNPPYLACGAARSSPDSDRAMAHMLDEGGAEKWLRAGLALLRPGGIFVAIHRADALADLLAALEGRLGELRVLPIFPREGEKAVRVILRGRKGSKAPLALLPGLVLHEADGRFTPAAAAIHRQGRRIFPD